MKQDIKDLIKTEGRRDMFTFLTDVIQRGRIKPAKFIHSITIPVYLFEDLRRNNVVVPENYFIDESAFFEFRNDEAIISFIHLYSCEDMHRRILTYLVIKFAGSCPVKRSGVSKMNFYRTKEPVVLIRTKTGKKSRP